MLLSRGRLCKLKLFALKWAVMELEGVFFDECWYCFYRWCFQGPDRRLGGGVRLPIRPPITRWQLTGCSDYFQDGPFVSLS